MAFNLSIVPARPSQNGRIRSISLSRAYVEFLRGRVLPLLDGEHCTLATHAEDVTEQEAAMLEFAFNVIVERADDVTLAWIVYNVARIPSQRRLAS